MMMKTSEPNAHDFDRVPFAVLELIREGLDLPHVRDGAARVPPVLVAALWQVAEMYARGIKLFLRG